MSYELREIPADTPLMHALSVDSPISLRDDLRAATAVTLWSENTKAFKHGYEEAAEEGRSVVALGRVGGCIVSMEDNGCIKVWDERTAVALAEVPGGGSGAVCGVGSELLVACYGGSVKLFPLQADSLLNEKYTSVQLPQEAGHVTCCEGTTVGTDEGFVYSLASTPTLVGSGTPVDGVVTFLLTPPNESFIFAGTEHSDTVNWHGHRRGSVAVIGVDEKAGELPGPLGASDGSIRGGPLGLAVYKGYALVVAAKNLTTWTMSEGTHPLLKKGWSKMHGIADPHQGTVCTAVCVVGDAVVTAGGDGALKLWNFRESHGARPFALRNLPPASGRIACLVCSPQSDELLVAGNFDSVRAWDFSAAGYAFALDDDKLPKSTNGNAIPISYGLPPTKEYARASNMTVATTLFDIVMTLLQFLSLPFADDGLWTEEAGAMTKTIPMLNIELRITGTQIEVKFWVLCAVSIIFFFILVYGVVDRCLLTAAESQSSAKCNWLPLRGSEEEKAAELRSRDAHVLRATSRAARFEKAAKAASGFTWVVSGVLLMPLVSSLAESFACFDGRWTLDTSRECYRGYHLARSISAGIVLVFVVLLALRLTLVGKDAKCLCRPIVRQGGGYTVAGVRQRLASGPWWVCGWRRLPPLLHPGGDITAFQLSNALLKILAGVLSAVLLRSTPFNAKVHAVLLVVIFFTITLCFAKTMPYMTLLTRRVFFCVHCLTTFAGSCRLVSVLTAATGHPEVWPAILWYAGIVPCIGAAYVAHRIGTYVIGPKMPSQVVPIAE